MRTRTRVPWPTISCLNQLAAVGLVKCRFVTANYYVNQPLFVLLARLR